ncbi:MAG: hypothetical protein ABIJ04_03775 [Bacteroidota bacterium]
MKTIKRITALLLLLLPFLVRAELKEIPFTLDDRDRIIRTEQKVESLQIEMNTRFEGIEKQFQVSRSEMNTRFESIYKRFDQLFNFLWAFIGIFTAMMATVFGFAFWDRKLSLAPMKREEEKIKSALHDFAKTQPKLAEILKNAGLL